MKEIKVKTPAKINLVLEILRKRPDGFHDIQSIMQAVSLFDYLTISVESGSEEIIISGNSPEIPYNEDNIAYKASKLFLNEIGMENQRVKIYIEKNIPVAAGLAGGSSDAAGVLWGLNKLFENPLTDENLHQLAAKLGSDLNFCLTGGTCTTISRGEVIQPISTPELDIIIIKPSNLSISAKEAYTRYSELFQKPVVKNFEQMKTAIEENNIDRIVFLLNNDLERAIIPEYLEIEQIKKYLLECGCENVIMSGSGPSVFGVCSPNTEVSNLHEGWECFKVKTISYGVTKAL